MFGSWRFRVEGRGYRLLADQKQFPPNHEYLPPCLPPPASPCLPPWRPHPFKGLAQPDPPSER